MWKQRALKSCAILGIFVLAVTPTLAREKKDTITIDIEDSEGSKTSISLTTDLVSGVIEGMVDEDLECDGDIEADTREMFEYLSKNGRGSRYTLEKEDGEVIKAHRRKDQLELEILKPDEDPTQVSMPWLLAECMLGNKVAAKELEKADGLKFSVKKDGGVELRVE
ncbi:MAG: hypothetical protein WBP34_05605 [Thermoanaerobaculia bacterium]|jgi:hypothetical protein